MKIVEVKIEELKPAEYNPRGLTEKEFDDLSKSISEFGMVEPIVVNENEKRKNIIIGGHQRYYICKKLGWERMPVVYVNLTLEKEKELNLRLNKNLGHWDYDLLAKFGEDDLLRVGFNSEELDEVFGVDVEDDKIPELPEKATTKLGDLYQLGDHRLLCGDSTKREDVEKLMGGEKADMVFTSPPYNMGAGMYKNYADNLPNKEFIGLHLKVFRNIKEFVNGFIFWNVSYNKNARWEFLEILYKIIKEPGVKFLELIVWDKGHGMPITSKEMVTRQYEDILLVGSGEFQKDLELFYCGATKRAYFNKKTNKGITNYWRIDTNKTQLESIKAAFPVKLPKQGIMLMSNRGDIVLDAFGGSGSTLIAAEQLNRKCYMIELDPRYCDVIIKRYEQFTNNKAIKL